MQKQTIIVDIKNKIATLYLNREEVLNAINRELINSLRESIEKFRFDKNIRVIVITGNGKGFCAGADLKERIKLTELEVKEFIYNIRNTFNNIANFPKPVISAINGIALGGGTELALATDIRIASSNAKMGLTETKLAIIPGAGGTQRLPRLIGYGKAKELIFTGKILTSQESLEIGLVNKVTEPDNLLNEVYQMAELICENGPIAIEQAKKAINKGAEVDIETGLAFETEAYQTCIYTQDRIEGLKAFQEKRKPEYKGL
jgi:enoyl-CoA hydratase/carnithine racemase